MMNRRFHVLVACLAHLVLASGLAAAGPAGAQAVNSTPPATRSGAPILPPTTATPADRLPLGLLHLPAGFHLEVFQAGLVNARELAIDDEGTVFVGTRTGDQVRAVVTRNGKREVKVIASGLHRPNGVAVRDGNLYVAEVSRVLRFDRIEQNLDHPPAPRVIYDDLPADEAHGWKFIAIGPDNKLYVPVGLPCNSCLPPPTHAQIRRINLDGSGAEVVARGVRNTVGFDWNPEDGALYFTDNGRDLLSDDAPEDELNRLDHVGEHFGAPYCYQGNVSDPELGKDHPCSEFKAPVGLMGPHAAALGMRFYTGSQFPPGYRHAAFVARHGSWNRKIKFGGDVVAVHLDEEGKVRSIEPFLTGFIRDNEYLGRPNDVAVMADGSLLVSDDYNGAIYRITYGGP